MSAQLNQQPSWIPQHFEQQLFSAAMAALSHTQLQIPPFECDNDPTTIGPRWERWINRFENYLTAVNITNDARWKALLLHLGGERVHDIYDNDTLSSADDNYTAAKDNLDTYFKPMKDTATASLHIQRDSTAKEWNYWPIHHKTEGFS